MESVYGLSSNKAQKETSACSLMVAICSCFFVFSMCSSVVV